MNKKILIFIAVNLFLVNTAFAQFPLEFAAGSMAAPIPIGPTTASQTAQWLIDPPSSGAPSGTFVTVSLSNQQWTGVNTTPDNAVVMFGATNNPNFGETFARSVPTFAPMNVIGSPTNDMFSNELSGNPVGIDVNVNYAFNLFTSVQHWAGLTSNLPGVPATNARVYMANLTLTFSRPLTNPYIHIIGKGGTTGFGLGFATGLDLATPGITLEKVQGTTSLSVSANQIDNTAANIQSSCPNNLAACGTVRLRGNNITSVTFRVYIRGDGGHSSWGNPNFHNGDQWMIGVSTPSQSTSTPATGEIAGRLVKNGEPINGTLVKLIDTETNRQTVVYTDNEGKYRFGELRVGKGYVVEPVSSKYKFSPSSSLVDMTDNVDGLNFSAESKRYKAINDFDGDGKSDIGVYRPEDGNWFTLYSSTGQMNVFRFGAEGDQPIAGDFDGDGKSDYTVYRPSEGIWYIWQSATQSLRAEKFGLPTDKLVAEDYDGDGKTDIAVFRDGMWYIQKSIDRSVAYISFGLSDDKPIPADYDGDGRTDVAVYREGTWHILDSTSGYRGIAFGLATDKPIPADYDGDGKADIGVYRDGDWHVLSSSIGYAISRFGISSDKLVPADYDGDGKTDFAVYRDGVWHLQQTQSGYGGISFGKVTDRVVHNAFVP